MFTLRIANVFLFALLEAITPNAHFAIMTVGGWFDAEDIFGPLDLSLN